MPQTAMQHDTCAANGGWLRQEHRHTIITCNAYFFPNQKWLGEHVTILHMHCLSCLVLSCLVEYRLDLYPRLEALTLPNGSHKCHVCKTSKILSKVQRKFWDMLEQNQTKQNSLRRILVQSLDSKSNGNILYFLYIRHTNKKNRHTTVSSK
jgi:hypothetical protein